MFCQRGLVRSEVEGRSRVWSWGWTSGARMVMFKRICSYVFGYDAPHIAPLPRLLGPLARPAPTWDLILQRFPDYEDPNFPHSLPDNHDVRQRIRLILSDDFRCQFYERVRAQTAASAASWGKERIEQKLTLTVH